MITNTGKNIIAKYLIGDAPAYASYIALGCGPTPRPVITTKSGVSVATVQGGTILSTGSPAVNGKFITQVTGISSTAGLVVGMVLTKTSTGGGSFGTLATISSIDSLTKITVEATTANVAGVITFSATGPSQLLSASSTTGLWVGAKVTIASGVGALSTLTDTIVTAISSGTNFTITPGSTTNPSNTTIALEIDPDKQSLDFEMFRVPISSRGYVNDNGVNKIVLTAQLPTEERYEISEIGIYSAGSNSAAGQYDSKTISAFSAEENWKLSFNNTLSSPSLQNSNFTEAQDSLIDGQNIITNTPIAIKTSSTNGLFSNAIRSSRYERPRYLSNVFMLRGNSSYLYNNSTTMEVLEGSSFLQLSGQNVDLTKNSSSDLMKLAFSVVSVLGASSEVPDKVRVVVEFSNTEGTQFARMLVEAKDSVYRFENNRYLSIEKRLDELFYTSAQFSWRNVSVIKTYAAAILDLEVTNKVLLNNVATVTTSGSHGLEVNDYAFVSGVDGTFDGIHKVTAKTSNTFSYAKTASNVVSQAVITDAFAEVPNKNFYIALDALRVDNISTVNPLYGLTGYSIIQNSDRVTVTKSPNTNNYIEYRFILDVT